MAGLSPARGTANSVVREFTDWSQPPSLACGYGGMEPETWSAEPETPTVGRGLWTSNFSLQPLSVMRFSIITPSYCQLEWLKLCVASVADQGVEAEHIVQDAGSDDGTQEWLAQESRVKAFVEKDQGMYDAINRGLRRASGEILAYLNCDEQYLPGALAAVGRRFQDHPALDMVFGDIVMVNAEGDYLCHRKVQPPLLYHTWVCHLSTLSCAMFFRRRVVLDRNQFFDPRWRDSGDSEWMVRLLRQGLSMAALKQFTSVFTQTGANMSAGSNARRENRALRRTAPLWARGLRPFLILHHRIRRLLAGSYRQRAFDYALYVRKDPARRQLRHVSKPTFRR